jgi:hypothetical protein
VKIVFAGNIITTSEAARMWLSMKFVSGLFILLFPSPQLFTAEYL